LEFFRTEPASGTAEIDGLGPNNTIKYIPVTSFVGDDPFKYIIEDGNGGTDWANVNVQVKEVQGITDFFCTF
jgi:hypothetical protein